MGHAHSAHSAARQVPRTKAHQRALAVVAATIILIVGAVGTVGINAATGGSLSARSADYSGDGNGHQELVEIPEGAVLSQLAGELAERDIVGSAEAFLTAAANNPQANSVQPGFYRLQQKMSAKAAVAAFVSDEAKVEMLDVPGGATLSDVMVVGGQTRHGIYSEISRVSCAEHDAESCVTVEALEKVAASVDPAQLGAPEWALDHVRERAADPKRLEGLIAPGKYVIDPGMSAEQIITQLVTKSAKVYADTGIVARAQAIGLTPYELLTAASLVEREAPVGEFDKVARVILNRLAEPMRLQFDSTVNYGLKSVEIATTDEDRKEVTPWNTYAMDGLPATPIASPSEDSITAMENPADGDWLYFVTISKDGTTVFNNTWEEHEESVKIAGESGVLDSQR